MRAEVIIKSIDQQIAQKQSLRHEPRRIYMDCRLYATMKEHLESMARYPDTRPVNSIQIQNIPVVIHCEFNEPVVI